jgi:outer membrane protein assembly factor BamE (lipoprotein component of BamABCDE complex)
MARTFLAALLLTTCVGSGHSSGPRQPGSQVAVEAEPDTTRARPLDRSPNAADLARLDSVRGRHKREILLVLGHPSVVDRRPDGEEVWDYPWSAACQVWIRKGVCTGTFYTGGY